MCSLRHDKLQCRLFWEGDTLLHMGWADCVKVARVRPVPASPLAGAEAKRSLEIVASFQTDYLVAVRPCRQLFSSCHDLALKTEASWVAGPLWFSPARLLCGAWVSAGAASTGKQFAGVVGLHGCTRDDLHSLQGIAPFGEDICLLAYMLDKEGADGAAAGGEPTPSAPESVPHEAQRPEVLYVDMHCMQGGVAGNQSTGLRDVLPCRSYASSC